MRERERERERESTNDYLMMRGYRSVDEGGKGEGVVGEGALEYS